MSQHERPKTLLEVARALSIRCATAQEFLERRGISGYRPDTAVPDPVAQLLAQEFQPVPSAKERFLRGVRRILGGVSRAERGLRKRALSLRFPAEIEQASVRSRRAEAEPASPADDEPEAYAPVPPSRDRYRESESDSTRVETPAPEARATAGGQVPTSPEPEAIPASFAETPQPHGSTPPRPPAGPQPRDSVKRSGEENEEILEQLESLEELLSRMSGKKEGAADESNDAAVSPDEGEGTPEGGVRPEYHRKDGGEGPERAGHSLDAADPFSFLEEEVDERSREEFLDESLRQLEVLLSELGSESSSAGAKEKGPRPPDGTPPPQAAEGEMREAEGPSPEEYVEAEPQPEARGPEEHPPPETESGGEETSHDDTRAKAVATPAVPDRESGSSEAETEPESLVSDLLDLSALLRELPQIEEEPASGAGEAPEAPPIVREETGPAPEPQPRVRSPIRKWIRRTLVPQAHSVIRTARAAFSQLAPAQRRVFFGFLALICAAVVAAAGWNYWSHRPGGDVILWRKGQALLAAGHPELARKEFAKLVQRYPDSEQSESPYLRRSMYLLGECLYQQGAYAAALSTFLRVRKLLEEGRPREIDGLLYPDFTFRDQGEMRIADCYVREGRFEEGIAIYESIIARDDHAPVARRAALARGEAFLAWGDREGSAAAYRKAAQVFTIYRERHPEDESAAMAHWKTGLAYLGLSRRDQENARDHLLEAAGELAKARALETGTGARDSDGLARLSLDLAETYFQLSQWPEAIAEYERLLSSSSAPESVVARARLGRARALLESGEFEAALTGASEAADNSSSPKERGEALFTMGDAAWELRRYDEMLKAYEEALNLCSGEDVPPAYAERAHMRITNVLYTQDRKYGEAAERYQRIVSRYPDGPYTHLALYRLGCSLFELGRYEDAAGAFKRSIHDYPQFEHRDPDLLVDAYYRAADCYVRLQAWPEAVEALKGALQDLGFPEDERGRRARFDLASCYAALALYDRAVAVLQGYLEKFPEDDGGGDISMTLGRYHRCRFDFAAAREVHARIAREHDGQPVATDAVFEEGKDLLAQAAMAPEAEKRALRSAALLRFEKVLQARPGDATALLEIARVHHGERDFPRAKVYLSRYFELGPEDSGAGEARFLAADTAYMLGDYSAAAAHFGALDSAGLAEAVIAQASYEHADACRELGDLERAQVLYRETARLFPSTQWGKEARWQLDHLAWQGRLAESPVN